MENELVTQNEIIIESITRAGKQFRPSDWVDRMCSSYATFGEAVSYTHLDVYKRQIVGFFLFGREIN